MDELELVNNENVILKLTNQLAELIGSNTRVEETNKPLDKVNENKLIPKELFSQINQAIREVISQKEKHGEEITLTILRDVIYAAGQLIIKESGQEKPTRLKRKKWLGDPPWKRRLMAKVEDLRKEISQLTEIRKRIESNRMKKRKQVLYQKYSISSETDLMETIERLIQKLQAKSARTVA